LRRIAGYKFGFLANRRRFGSNAATDSHTSLSLFPENGVLSKFSTSRIRVEREFTERRLCRRFGITSGLAVILPQLAKTSRMTCESVSMSGLAMYHQLSKMTSAGRRSRS
jgi:hypothetical protein